MPRLSSRSKHEEFESNSTLQIRIKRKEGAEAEKKEKQRISHHGAKISFLQHYSPVLLFDVVPYLFQFLFLPILSL